MRSDTRLSRCFAALHLAIVTLLVLAELGGFFERIVPPFALPPTAEIRSPDRAVQAGTPADPQRWHPLDGVKFVPETQGGQTVGLRLNGVGGEGLFAKLGLRDGDRLDSVGGYRVTSPSEMIALYTRLRALDVLNLLIERDGQPMTITIRLR